jgi:hypothetical protein
MDGLTQERAAASGTVLRAGPDTCPKMGYSKRDTEIADQATRSAEGMHVCPTCASDLVQPAQWFEQGEGRWHVDLRCPECEWWGRGSFSQTEVDGFDEQLDRGAQELLEDLRSLTRSNMEDEADAFAQALACDVILPEDF